MAKTSFEKMQESAKGDLDQKHQAIDHLLKPLTSSLEKVDEKIQSLEKARVGAYESLSQHLKTN